jgi:hypothetical protein
VKHVKQKGVQKLQPIARIANPAREFLETFYAKGVEFDADWDHVDEEVLVKLREAAASGDEALQSLLASLAFSKFKTAEQAARLSAALGGIKMMSVTDLFEELPHTSLEDLRAAAEAAGYEVEVL